MTDTAAKTYHHGNLRSELLDTAERQLQAVGMESLSLRALARDIGVSQTAPYRHFSDKNELLAALATRGYRELLDKLRQAALEAGDCPESQLYRFAHSYINYATAKPALFKLMFGPTLQPVEQYPDLRDAIRDTYDEVRGIIRRGIERGDFQQHNIEYLANAGWSSIHGLAILSIDMPQLFERKVELPKQVDLGVSTFIDGIHERSGGSTLSS